MQILSALAVAGFLVAATTPPPSPAITGPVLVSGKTSAYFLGLKKGTAAKVVDAKSDGSEVDIVTASELIQFFIDPATTSWPREIERVVQTLPSGKKRGGYSHGEIAKTADGVSFSGSGFIPIGKFKFSVQ